MPARNQGGHTNGELPKWGQCRLRALLQRLMSHPLQGGQGWFNEKVDPGKLGLPDYFRIVTKPMDLGTVKSNLSASRYAGAPEFAADVRLGGRFLRLVSPWRRSRWGAGRVVVCASYMYQ